jgi:hypothetical protein
MGLQESKIVLMENKKAIEQFERGVPARLTQR